MQFKTLLSIASLAALAFAAPEADLEDGHRRLTTHFTTETFTATQVFQSILPKPPYITTVTHLTTWTVAHTVTRAAPTGAAAPA